MTDAAVTFSTAGILVAVAAPLLLTVALALVARAVPPAVRVPGVAGNVGGLMLVFFFFLAAEATFVLFQFGRAAGEAAGVIAMDASFAWPALKTIIPQGVAAVGMVVMLLLLTVGRSPGALYGAVVAFWVAGPVADFLRMPLLGIPFDVSQNFMGISVFTIIATCYLLFSTRTSLLYGTRSGRQIAARYEAIRKTNEA